jgi:hypothetical protein
MMQVSGRRLDMMGRVQKERETERKKERKEGKREGQTGTKII